MDDDTSYSWQGVFHWTIKKPSKGYTEERSQASAGKGYILDFGQELNKKFQNALVHAYDWNGPYDPIANNCGRAFNAAINTIAKEAGITKTVSVLPSGIKEYLEKNLAPNGFVKGTVDFPKR